MKRKTLLLALLAVVIVAMASIGPAMSYFTTYAETRGTRPLHMGEETVEWLSQWRKHVQVENTAEEGALPVFVRATATGNPAYPLSYAPGANWYDGGDGWWYYSEALDAGEQTTVLDVLINDVPAEITEGSTFNVVVYTQSVYVTGGVTDGRNADWSGTMIVDDEQWGGTDNG